MREGLIIRRLEQNSDLHLANKADEAKAWHLFYSADKSVCIRTVFLVRILVIDV